MRAADAVRLVGRVVGTADEWAGLHVGDAVRLAGFLETREFVRVVVPVHRQMLLRRLQVLPHRQDVAAHCGHVTHEGMDGFIGFAESHHDARLGLRAAGLRAFEQLERLVVPRLGPHRPVEFRHRLQVVVEQVGTGVEHGLKRFFRSLEIRDEHFHAHAWAPAAYGPDRLGEDRRAAVGPFVPVDRGDHGEPQAQLLHGPGHALGLVPVQPLVRPARLHRAEPAAACADIAQDHEGGGPLLPAFPDIRALGALADGVKPVVPDQALQFPEIRPLLQAHLEPRGLGDLGCSRFAHGSLMFPR